MSRLDSPTVFVFLTLQREGIRRAHSMADFVGRDAEAMLAMARLVDCSDLVGMACARALRRLAMGVAHV